MTFGPALRIMTVAMICVLGLIGIIVHEGAARASGREIMMEMQPVDPRSLLSGQYVMLNLQADVAGADVCHAFSANADATWLSLIPNGAAAPPSYAPRGQFNAPDNAGGAVNVRGSATCAQLPDDEGKPQNIATVRTTLDGVSRFYVDQSEAERIDALMRSQPEGPSQVLAILSIGADGRARLKGLMVQGRRLDLSWL